MNRQHVQGSVGKATVRALFDPELAKWVIEQMVVEAGVEVLYNTKVVNVLMLDKFVTGAIIETSLGRTEVEAKVTIDATGDGWVALNAGANFELGRPEDSLCQPLSLYYVIGGIKLDLTLDYLSQHAEEFGKDYVNQVVRLKKEGKPLTLLSFRPQIREAIKHGDYPTPYGAEGLNPDTQFTVSRPMFKNGKMRYDIIAHNQDMAYRVNAADPVELSKALIGMRDVAVKMAAFYRKYVPGYEDSYLLQTAQKAGVRDTYRIIGDYVLTKEDVLSGRTFEDAIGRGGAAIDIHNIDSGKELIRLTEIGGKGWYHIPYRILLPRGIDNLLVVGRCVSTDHVANGTLRNEASSMLTGQAAGTAAALSAKEEAQPRAISVSNLQKVLTSHGVLI